MPPNGALQLILPGAEVTNAVSDLVDLHREWFKDSTWTIETNIRNMKMSGRIASATTSAWYKEPLRDGKPSFNRMIVSYILEEFERKWYVVKDHACSLEKSTDEGRS